MSAASTAIDMSPRLLGVVERAKNPSYQFNSLAHLIDEGALERAFRRLDGRAAEGVDGVTKAQYGEALGERITELHAKLREGRWRHQPIRRVNIPKGRGKTRPIGISCVEDKLVQGSLAEFLGAVYEPMFRPCSFGFRPGRGAHDALRALNDVLFREPVAYILEIDIESFFDSIDRARLQEMLWERVADKSLRRLVGKCLHVGILEGVSVSYSDVGTTQGSSLSPLLGNVYLHHVLDTWYEDEVAPRLEGRTRLFRYADDAVLTFESEADAHRVLDVLPKRFARFGLRLHPEKTRLVPFRRPPRSQRSGRGPGTFDFLGFTVFWHRARSGTWVPRLKTRKESSRRFLESIADYCRRQRHLPVREQHAALERRLNGFFNYFAVNGNVPTLRGLRRQCERIWHTWLGRRSEKARKSWRDFAGMLRQFPMPKARVRVQLWGAPP